MNKLKTALALTLALAGLAGVSVLPATAAETIASCRTDINSHDYGNPQNDFDPSMIANELAGKGLNVQGVEDWSGCAKVQVLDKQGQVHNQFYDPATLQRLSVG